MDFGRFFAGFALVFGWLLFPVTVWAEPADPGIEAEEAVEYVDRLIDGGRLEPLISQTENGTGSSKGNIRSLVAELSGSRISPKSRIAGVDDSDTDRSQNEIGMSISGRYQTDNYGLFGIDAELRRGTENRISGGQKSDSTNVSITLSNRGFPLGSGWLADSAVGMVTATAIPLVRRQPRFYIPTSPLLGGTVTLKSYHHLVQQVSLEDLEPRVSFNISAGEPGVLGGLRLAEFSGLSGMSVTGGGEIEVTPRLVAGVQAIVVDNTHDPYSVIFQSSSLSSGEVGKVSGQAVLASASYTTGKFRIQGNAMWSHLSGQVLGSTLSSGGDDLLTQDVSSKAAGAWFDATYRTGRSSHSGGMFYFGPDLTWGAAAIVNNAYGGYYRFTTSSQRWRWTFSLDTVDSVNGRSASGVIMNGDVRRQLTFNTGLGVNSTVRVANKRTSSQLLAYVDFSNRFGSTRAEAGWSHDPASDLYHAGWNQNWSLPAWVPSGSRLSTQLSFDHKHQSEESFFLEGEKLNGRTNSFGAAVSAGASPFSGISFDTTLAFNSDASTSSSGVYGPVDATGGALGVLSSQQGRAFSATVSATARLSPNWSLSASFTSTRSSLVTRNGLAGLASSPLGFTQSELADAQKSTFRLVAGYLTLRYSISAGRRKGSVGWLKYPVGGTGALEGRVYLDGNANRQREPSEAGVAGVVVILDGIHAVRTDQSGYYRFDNVSDGSHRVTVNADALPLPWSIVSDDGSDAQNSYARVVKVGVRSTTRLDIAAGR